VEELAVSGISGVEWDAVELPSQFMENFGWRHEVLAALSGHVETCEPLPRELFDRLEAARHFGAGLRLLGYIEKGVFDLRVHLEPGAAGRVREIARAAEASFALQPRPEGDRWPNGFLHIFDGAYAAGYYGYHWAEVLSADAFAAFEEAGIFDPATGRRFRETVLEVGGSRPAMDSFVAFRGREPRLEALLRHQGLA
jgi:oligopeptidase A